MLKFLNKILHFDRLHFIGVFVVIFLPLLFCGLILIYAIIVPDYKDEWYRYCVNEYELGNDKRIDCITDYKQAKFFIEKVYKNHDNIKDVILLKNSFTLVVKDMANHFKRTSLNDVEVINFGKEYQENQYCEKGFCLSNLTNKYQYYTNRFLFFFEKDFDDLGKVFAFQYDYLSCYIFEKTNKALCIAPRESYNQSYIELNAGNIINNFAHYHNLSNLLREKELIEK